MARLTRMQKYADFREELSNSREDSLRTNVLDAYSDRMKSIDEELGNEIKNALERQNEIANFVDDEFFDNENKETPTEDLRFAKVEPQEELNQEIDDKDFNIEKPEEEDDFFEFKKRLDQVVNQVLGNDESEEIEDNDVVIKYGGAKTEDSTDEQDYEYEPEPQNDETNQVEVEEIPEESVGIEIEQEPIEEETQFENPVEETPTEEVEVVPTTQEPVVVEIKENKKAITPIDVDEIVDSLLKIIGPLDELKIKEITPYVPPVVETPVEEKQEETEEPVIETEQVQAEEEVNFIPEEELEPVQEEKEIDDFFEPVSEKENEELSESITSQIDQVLLDAKEAIVETEKEPDLTAVFDSEEFRHPVLEKQEELEKDVVEILPMEETLKFDVVDDTIPFTGFAQDEESEEELEDTSFSKAINIILIALIAILAVILGVVIYYIIAMNS